MVIFGRRVHCIAAVLAGGVPEQREHPGGERLHDAAVWRRLLGCRGQHGGAAELVTLLASVPGLAVILSSVAAILLWKHRPGGSVASRPTVVVEDPELARILSRGDRLELTPQQSIAALKALFCDQRGA